MVTSSTSSLLTCSYSAINANNLSISPFNDLFLSKFRKCAFLNFYSSDMIMSSSFSWTLMFAYTSFSLAESYFPLLTSLFKFPMFFSISCLFLFACWSKLLYVIYISAIVFFKDFNLFSALLASSFLCLSSEINLALSFYACLKVLSSRAFVDSWFLTCFSKFFKFIMFSSRRADKVSQSSSSLFLYSLRPLTWYKIENYSDCKWLVLLIGTLIFALDGFDFISEVLDFSGPGIAHSFHGGIVSEKVINMNRGFLDINFERIELLLEIENGISVDVGFDSE